MRAWGENTDDQLQRRLLSNDLYRRTATAAVVGAAAAIHPGGASAAGAKNSIRKRSRESAACNSLGEPQRRLLICSETPSPGGLMSESSNTEEKKTVAVSATPEVQQTQSVRTSSMDMQHQNNNEEVVVGDACFISIEEVGLVAAANQHDAVVASPLSSRDQQTTEKEEVVRQTVSPADVFGTTTTTIATENATSHSPPCRRVYRTDPAVLRRKKKRTCEDHADQMATTAAAACIPLYSAPLSPPTRILSCMRAASPLTLCLPTTPVWIPQIEFVDLGGNFSSREPSFRHCGAEEVFIPEQHHQGLAVTDIIAAAPCFELANLNEPAVLASPPASLIDDNEEGQLIGDVIETTAVVLPITPLPSPPLPQLSSFEERRTNDMNSPPRGSLFNSATRLVFRRRLRYGGRHRLNKACSRSPVHTESLSDGNRRGWESAANFHEKSFDSHQHKDLGGDSQADRSVMSVPAGDISSGIGTNSASRHTEENVEGLRGIKGEVENTSGVLFEDVQVLADEFAEQFRLAHVNGGVMSRPMVPFADGVFFPMVGQRSPFSVDGSLGAAEGVAMAMVQFEMISLRILSRIWSPNELLSRQAHARLASYQPEHMSSFMKLTKDQIENLVNFYLDRVKVEGSRSTKSEKLNSKFDYITRSLLWCLRPNNRYGCKKEDVQQQSSTETPMCSDQMDGGSSAMPAIVRTGEEKTATHESETTVKNDTNEGRSSQQQQQQSSSAECNAGVGRPHSRPTSSTNELNADVMNAWFVLMDEYFSKREVIKEEIENDGIASFVASLSPMCRSALGLTEETQPPSSPSSSHTSPSSPAVVFLSTDFMTMVEQALQATSSTESEGEPSIRSRFGFPYAVGRLQRFFRRRKISPWDCELLCFPINYMSSHWVLLVADIKRKELVWFDSYRSWYLQALETGTAEIAIPSASRRKTKWSSKPSFCMSPDNTAAAPKIKKRHTLDPQNAEQEEDVVSPAATNDLSSSKAGGAFSSSEATMMEEGEREMEIDGNRTTAETAQQRPETPHHQIVGETPRQTVGETPRQTEGETPRQKENIKECIVEGRHTQFDTAERRPIPIKAYDLSLPVSSRTLVPEETRPINEEKVDQALSAIFGPKKKPTTNSSSFRSVLLQLLRTSGWLHSACVEEYLKEDYKARYPSDEEGYQNMFKTPWKRIVLDNLPQQRAQAMDCGVFTCQFARCIGEYKSTCRYDFSAKDISRFRLIMAVLIGMGKIYETAEELAADAPRVLSSA